MAVEQTPDRARRHVQAMGLPDMVDQLGERKVGVLRQGHDLVGMRFKRWERWSPPNADSDGVIFDAM